MIPSAEEFVKHYAINHGPFSLDDLHTIYGQAAAAYARLHVQAALKAAADQAELLYDNIPYGDALGVDKQSILNAYPLNQIK